MSDELRIVAVLALIGANGFFVIGEYSIVTAGRAGLLQRAEQGSAGARSALRLMDDPVRAISAAQIGVTAIGILTGALGEPAVHRVLGDGMPRWLSFVLAFGLVAYVSVVLGELVPKALTLQRAEACAARVARPLEALATVLRPLIAVLERSALLVLRPFGIREIVLGRGVRTPAELQALVGEAGDAGVIPRSQGELLRNVFVFGSRTAHDVMIPTRDVVWIDAGSTVAAAIDVVFRAPHTRYPVRASGPGGALRVVHVRDLVRATRGIVRADAVRTLARPALVVAGSEELGVVLRRLRESRQHLAVVIDARGTAEGIVTMEDVVEEIVGEIEDEFDRPTDTALSGSQRSGT